MDESEKDHKLEDTQKVELESDEGVIVIEGDVADDDDHSETLKETHVNDDESIVLGERSIPLAVLVDSEEPPKEKEEEEKVVFDSTEPVESLPEEYSTKVPTDDVESESKEIEVNEAAASPVVSNGVYAPLVMDVVSKGIEPSLDESETNGVSSNIVNNLVPKGVESSTDENYGVSSNIVNNLVPKGVESSTDENYGVSSNIVNNLVPKGVESSTDENYEASSVVTDSISKDGFEETKLPVSDGNASLRESSVAVDMVPKADVIRGVHAGNGGENCSTSEVHTRNQPYISVIPSPVQRTSWRGCCGLFALLRRSNH